MQIRSEDAKASLSHEHMRVVMGHLDEAHRGRSVRPDRGKVLVVIVQFSGRAPQVREQPEMIGPKLEMR
jgi:hypothetical protein